MAQVVETTGTTGRRKASEDLQLRGRAGNVDGGCRGRDGGEKVSSHISRLMYVCMFVCMCLFLQLIE